MYSKEESDSSSMLFEQEDTAELDSIDQSLLQSEQGDVDDDKPIHLPRRIVRHQRDWDDEISSENVFKQFSYSSVSNDFQLEEILREDLLTNLGTFELNESVTLLLPQNAWERTSLFDRRSACILSRIDGVRRMSTMQLVSPAVNLSESFSQHQSVLSVESIKTTSSEQNEQSRCLEDAIFLLNIS